jgi:hypothetical protein
MAKLWHRGTNRSLLRRETPEQKKQRRALARTAARKRPFKAKESYRWVEALHTVNKQVGSSTRHACV